jgi:hypothetical protein
MSAAAKSFHGWINDHLKDRRFTRSRSVFLHLVIREGSELPSLDAALRSAAVNVGVVLFDRTILWWSTAAHRVVAAFCKPHSVNERYHCVHEQNVYTSKTIHAAHQVKTKPKKADLEALRVAGEKMRQLIAAAGTTEEELMEDFKRDRRERRMQKDSAS